MSARQRLPQDAPLRLAPQRSRCLLQLALGLHALALTAVLAGRLPGSWTLLLGLLIAASLSRELFRHWRSSSGQALISAVWHADGHWQLQDLDGRERSPTRWDAPLVHPRLVLLRFRQGRFRCLCLRLCPDANDAEQLRRLRARLQVRGMSGRTGET